MLVRSKIKGEEGLVQAIKILDLCLKFVIQAYEMITKILAFNISTR